MVLIVAIGVIGIIGFVSGRGNWSIMNFASILSIFGRLFVVFEVITCSLTFAIYGVDWSGASIHNIGLEEIGNLSNIVGFEFLAIERWIHFEVKIKKILGPIILIHAYIFELKVDFDEVIGEKGWEFDELISKILNELIINIGNPCL